MSLTERARDVRHEVEEVVFGSYDANLASAQAATPSHEREVALEVLVSRPLAHA